MGKFQIEFTNTWPTQRTVELDDPQLVGQNDRTWLIPLLHSTLANPSGAHAWPRYDKVTGLTDACAYWETAYYLLGIMLGWSDIGLGLKRLYDGLRPGVDSPHLDLLDQIWNDRGQLDLFALWAWQRGVHVKSDGHNAFAPDEALGRTPEAFSDSGWHDQFLKRYPGYGIAYDHDPYHGGSNPLHLGSCLGAFEEHQGMRALVTSPSDRRAVLMLNAAKGWCWALDRLELPDLGEHSWHVDVVVRPVGWLGTFRRSRKTGRWFAGKHSVHALGHE